MEARVVWAAVESGSGCLGQVVRKKKVRRGCTGSSSLAKGQRARALHEGRFRYEDRREEMIAHGLADLGDVRRVATAAHGG